MVSFSLFSLSLTLARSNLLLAAPSVPVPDLDHFWQPKVVRDTGFGQDHFSHDIAIYVRTIANALVLQGETPLAKVAAGRCNRNRLPRFPLGNYANHTELQFILVACAQ